MDWKSVVDQLTELERTPQTIMASEQATIRTQSNAYKTIQNSLNVLKLKVDVLKTPDLFTARSAKAADTSVMSATAAAGSAVGNYSFNVSQLSKAAAQQGASNVGNALSATNDVSGLVLADAGFGTAVSAGTFTVNGQAVSVATTDTLQDVFDRISTATGGVVTGAYDSGTDRITLSSTGPLILGTTTDSSNFLQVAKLYNNETGTGSVSSGAALGSIRQNATLATANFTTPVTDGGGAGVFKVNGVEIAFNATTDQVGDVLKRINNSAAGVNASYDVINDRFTLTNKTGGDVGISLEDVSGNFLAATGISGGTLVRGQDMEYTVNDGPTLYARGNVIDEASSGIAGLSVTVLKEGTSGVDVSADTAKVRTAVNEFLTSFNTLQDTIESFTASSTDSSGKVLTAALTNDGEAGDIGSYLRRVAYGQVSGLDGVINRLEKLGINTNGNDNKLALSDATKLDDALANNLADVEKFFSDSTRGLATSLSSYLDKMVGDDGQLLDKQTRYTNRITDLDKQIADQEKQVQSRRAQWLAAFQAMETAQAKANQQLQYLVQQFA